MIEHVQAADVRDWYGDDLLNLQHEQLDVLQAYFEPYGSCVLKGCEITANGSDWDISEGIVAIDHADGFKVARFAGATAVALPGYLSIGKTTQTGAYSSGTADISNTYTAAFTAGAAPDGTALYLPFTEAGRRSFTDAFAAQSISDAETFVITNPGGEPVTGAVSIRKNTATGLLYIRGAVTVTAASMTNVKQMVLISDTDLETAGLLPEGDVYFTAQYPIGSTLAVPSGGGVFKEFSSSDWVNSISAGIQVTGALPINNGLFIRPFKPVTGIASYNIFFTAVVPYIA